MFYEVRIYNAKGKLKRIVPPEKVSKGYWQNFYNALTEERLRPQVKRGAKPGFTQRRSRNPSKINYARTGEAI